MNRDDVTADHIELSEAQKNPELRQEYLNTIDLGWARQYVSSVLYSPEMPSIARTEPHPEAKKVGKGHPSTIVVGPHFFDPNFSTITDHTIAVSIIRDHEGKHAEDDFKNPSVFRNIPKYPSAHLIGEWRAFREQLRGFMRDLSHAPQAYKKSIKELMEEWRGYAQKET